MHVARAGNLSLSMLTGVLVGVLLGDPVLGCLFGVMLTVALWAVLWRRAQRGTGQRQAHVLLLLQAAAERAIRAGQVTSCWGCKRVVRREARRCLYCGMYRLEGPLR